MNDPKEKIRLLIDKYEIAKSAGKIKSYTEEETKRILFCRFLKRLGGMLIIKMRFQRKKIYHPRIELITDFI